MFKLFLQCNDEYSYNLISENSNILSKISHIICNNTHETLMKNLFKLKLNHRNIKTLLKVHIDDSLNIFDFIKSLCNCGFDGFIFTIEDKTQIDKCYKIFKIINLLPEPYNFQWDIYYLDLCDQQEFTDTITGTLNSQNIYNTKLNNISNNSYITELNMNIINLINNIELSFDLQKNKETKNTINYPTSTFIKEIKIDRNLKRNAIYEIKFDIDFLN